MNNEAYKTTFYTAVRELTEMQNERAELEERQKYVDARITKLRETVKNLGELLDDNTYQDLLESRPELFR